MNRVGSFFYNKKECLDEYDKFEGLIEQVGDVDELLLTNQKM